MKGPYPEVTHRRGKPLAAYLYLPREWGDKPYRTSTIGQGMIVDFKERGKPIGIELTTPADVTLKALNKVLQVLGLPPLSDTDLKPLCAA